MNGLILQLPEELLKCTFPLPPCFMLVVTAMEVNEMSTRRPRRVSRKRLRTVATTVAAVGAFGGVFFGGPPLMNKLDDSENAPLSTGNADDRGRAARQAIDAANELLFVRLAQGPQYGASAITRDLIAPETAKANGGKEETQERIANLIRVINQNREARKALASPGDPISDGARVRVTAKRGYSPEGLAGIFDTRQFEMSVQLPQSSLPKGLQPYFPGGIHFYTNTPSEKTKNTNPDVAVKVTKIYDLPGPLGLSGEFPEDHIEQQEWPMALSTPQTNTATDPYPYQRSGGEAGKIIVRRRPQIS